MCSVYFRSINGAVIHLGRGLAAYYPKFMQLPSGNQFWAKSS